MSAVGDARKRLAERTQPDPTASAVRAAQAEALREARDDIKARIDTFNRLNADPQYINALHDAWGLVSNRMRGADRLAPAVLRVHNHPPYAPICNERRVDGHLRGACLNDDGSDRADRLATDTAAPEGRLDEEYAENLIGFVRTFETGEHAANALPIFLRSAMRPVAPVAVEGVETVETLAEVLAEAYCPNCGHHIDRHNVEILCFRSEHMRCEMKPSDILAARIVQARAGEGALRERVQAVLDKPGPHGRFCALRDSVDAACSCWRADIEAALATADPS